MAILRSELIRIFGYRKPDVVKLERYQQIREAYLGLAELVFEYLPESRERDEAITNLEISMMFALATIARSVEFGGGG